jgi:hypothetical protein
MSDPLPDRTPPTPLVYGLEDRVPFMPAVLVSFQQVSAMVVGTITPALILAGVLKFSPADTAYFVSIALLASAFGTFIQTRRFGLVGSGLLSVTGTSFAFLGPLIHAGQMGGLALMFGMSLAAAPVQFIFAPFLPKLQRVFAPIVSGVVVLLIGLSLIPTAMYGIAAPVAPGAPAWGGLLVAATVLLVVLAAQATGRTWARLGSVLFGLAAGYIVCGLAGWLKAPAPGDGEPAAGDPPGDSTAGWAALGAATNALLTAFADAPLQLDAPAASVSAAALVRAAAAGACADRRRRGLCDAAYVEARRAVFGVLHFRLCLCRCRQCCAAAPGRQEAARDQSVC